MRSSALAVASPVRDARFFQGLVYALAGAVAFSGKAIVAKLMYRLGADAFAVVGMRMMLALPLFALMAWWSGRAVAPASSGSPVAPAPLTPRQRWQIVGLGFTGYYLASTLDFMGLQYISASLERAILYLNPSLVLLMSVWWLRQPLRRAQLGAMALSYSGVLIVFLHDWDVAHVVAGSAHGLSPGAAIAVGGTLVFFSALAYAIYLMGSGQLVQQLGSLRLVGWASCAACFMCLAQWGLVYLASGGDTGRVAHLPWQAWALSLVNATACTVLPVWLVMQGVQRLGASVASQVGMVGPLSTIWMASWWLDEPITWRLMLGTAAVLAGIVALTRVNQARAAKA